MSSDGVTIWVWTTDDKIYAYDLATGARTSDDFTKLSRAGNGSPKGLWSDVTNGAP